MTQLRLLAPVGPQIRRWAILAALGAGALVLERPASAAAQAGPNVGEALDRVVAEALARNLGLAQSRAELLRAEATLDEAGTLRPARLGDHRRAGHIDAVGSHRDACALQAVAAGGRGGLRGRSPMGAPLCRTKERALVAPPEAALETRADSPRKRNPY